MSTALENTFIAHPEDGKVFVGIRLEDDIPKVYFPYGYRIANNEKEARKDILNLITILSKFGSKKEDVMSGLDKKNKSFPIHAYIGVFTYFLNYGYYVEQEKYYNHGDNGYVNWKKTIQTVQPQISNNNPVYLDFVVQKKRNNDNELITQIHKYCVDQSFQKIGCLFGFPKPEKSYIPFDEKLFISTLQLKISKTFNERELMLFRNMLDIILYSAKKENNQNVFYGTYDFDFIWEKLIDFVFGIDNKQDYFPHYQYSKIENGVKKKYAPTALQPDSIMIRKDGGKTKYYVIDAKCYRYWETKRECDLPKGDSINKQMSYAEYIKTKFKVDGKDIYNAFIMPYGSTADGNNFSIEKIITLDVNWKNANDSFETINGIFLDVKSIMYRHPKSSSKDIELLAKVIEQQVP